MISFVIWIMSTNICIAKTCIIDAVADVHGVSKWVSIYFPIILLNCNACTIWPFDKTGYLRYNMCGDDMAADFVCRICCYGCDYMAKSIPSLQHNQYDHIQFAGIFGIRITLTNHVLRSGECGTHFNDSSIHLLCLSQINTVHLFHLQQNVGCCA